MKTKRASFINGDYRVIDFDVYIEASVIRWKKGYRSNLFLSFYCKVCGVFVPRADPMNIPTVVSPDTGEEEPICFVCSKKNSRG